MPTLTYSSIDDALCGALEPLRQTLPIRLIEPYGGQFAPDTLGAESLVAFPALLVCVPELRSENLNRMDRRNVEILIYAADANLRGRAAALRGDSLSPGVYRMLEGVRGQVNGKKLHALLGAITLKTERIIYFSARKATAIAVARYTASALVTLA